MGVAAVVDWVSLRPEVTEELLADVARRIVERFAALKVILFGSYAWGDPDIESDVDLFVVMDTDDNYFERSRQVRRVADVPFLPMDVIVRTPAEIEERLAAGDTFIGDILERGLVLYERSG